MSELKLEHCTTTATGVKADQLGFSGLGEGKVKKAERLEPQFIKCNECERQSECKLHRQGAKGCTRMC